jgi:hypothetical protein
MESTTLAIKQENQLDRKLFRRENLIIKNREVCKM